MATFIDHVPACPTCRDCGVEGVDPFRRSGMEVGSGLHWRSFGYTVTGLCKEGADLFGRWQADVLGPVLHPFLRAVDARRKMQG